MSGGRPAAAVIRKAAPLVAIVLMDVQLGVSYAHFMQMPGTLLLPPAGCHPGAESRHQLADETGGHLARRMAPDALACPWRSGGRDRRW